MMASPYPRTLKMLREGKNSTLAGVTLVVTFYHS
jgi:hypothetical protein